jgi:hypothetical protein
MVKAGNDRINESLNRPMAYNNLPDMWGTRIFYARRPRPVTFTSLPRSHETR